MKQTQFSQDQRCALCGGDNDCAASRGEPVESCWCFSVVIPDSVLDRLPPELVGTRCICRSCALSEGGQRLGR